MLTPLALITVMIVAPFYWVHENPLLAVAIGLPAFLCIRQARKLYRARRAARKPYY